MTEKSKQLRILSDREIQEVFDYPHFSAEEQQNYFSLTAFEKDLIEEQFRTKTSRAYCILQLGYFKARRLFLSLSNWSDYQKDFQYIKHCYFPKEKVETKRPQWRTLKKHQQLILSLCGLSSCDNFQKERLKEKARRNVGHFGKNGSNVSLFILPKGG